MTDKNVLKEIIAAKRKNPYTEGKSIKQLREETEESGSKIPLPKNTIVEKIIADDVHAEWISCGNVNSNKTFMFIHGGGYYRGSIASTRATVARISEQAGVQCLSIDYRLAPENPFPAAIDDTYTAYNWILKQGINPKNIIVSGQSAGGGLMFSFIIKNKR